MIRSAKPIPSCGRLHLLWGGPMAVFARPCGSAPSLWLSAVRDSRTSAPGSRAPRPPRSRAILARRASADEGHWRGAGMSDLRDLPATQAPTHGITLRWRPMTSGRVTCEIGSSERCSSRAWLTGASAPRAGNRSSATRPASAIPPPALPRSLAGRFPGTRRQRSKRLLPLQRSFGAPRRRAPCPPSP